MRFFILFYLCFINIIIAQQNVTEKKVVFIIVDGISFDQLQNGSTPNLDLIGEQGSFISSYVGGEKDGYSQTPTVSAVGYNSLLTGTWANKHNVYGNGIKNPNYHYPNIFKIVADQKPDATFGVFSSWLDNRTKLVGEGKELTASVKIKYAFDGLEYDTINFPHDSKRNFMKLIDFSVAMRASEVIESQGPDLSWVYLEFTDDMGHAHGDSPYFNEAIAFEDYLVGKIYQSIRKRSFEKNEDWMLVVTTDHGRNAKNGKGHGGQSERERSTWIVSNKKLKQDNTIDYKSSVVDILPTMVSFLGLNIPEYIKKEWDGNSLLDPIFVNDFSASVINDQVQLSWRNISNHKKDIKIYVSPSNLFKNGQTDNYQYVSTVSSSLENALLPMSSLPNSKDGFYKFLLEIDHQKLNYWITKK